MIPVSVVIITKNEAHIIGETIQSVSSFTDDIIIVDSGSTDETQHIVQSHEVTLIETNWEGFGPNKNKGIDKARYDWILSIDADECVDIKLAESLKKADLSDDTSVFTMERLNYLGAKPIRFGEWGNDIVLRLFNKQNAQWDTSAVHEELIIKSEGQRVRLKGVLHHYTSPCIKIYGEKLKRYAGLMAEKYYSKGKKAHWYKMYFSPVVNFIQNYILKAGFLDGQEGLQIALAHASYTFEKYKFLKKKRTVENFL